MAKVVLTIGEKVIGARPLSREKPLVMGRGRDVDIVIPNLSVSRRHAKVYHRDGAWYFEDMGSTNGSFAAGRKVTLLTLVEGALVQVGRVVLRFELKNGGEAQEAGAQGAAGAYRMNLKDIWSDDKATGPILVLSPMDRETETVFVKMPVAGAHAVQTPGQAAAAPAAPAYLEYAGTTPPKRVVLGNDRASIGKGSDDEIKVEGLFVGNGHALLERRGDGHWYIVAVKKFPAVSVNGLKVGEHRLAFDDYIDLGSTRLWFRKGK